MLDVIFYIATAAEAMTAALAAGRRKMDWFGVCLLACVTALGGGTIRDLFLDHYPLYWVRNPYILLLVCGAALATIAMARVVDKLRWPFLLLDGLGLVVFTIIGCQVAIEIGAHPLIVLVAGMVTGIFGGILRDVLCNDVPLVFRGELYATVSLVTGAIYYFGLMAGIPSDTVILVAIAVGFPLRMVAIIRKWEMPKFVYDRDWR
ncbi:MAG: trimeric intracellular cation channel family protein [Alphaproteobacteria bacterium]|nr:trimeric intracellular cation channel family protein [Alphaproteobacteria bacterium]MBU1560633.1 trimeric intracellular cation channel family protein [Alphaproteobacteria bacterium]MBU2301983.1 trimeric intracellular cation channel family protein [Alphaproteobacteria bacterium]MBU2367412.1 trimeric intracellular cation channel family protein [Alphaproteobacteria bacterium]